MEHKHHTKPETSRRDEVKFHISILLLWSICSKFCQMSLLFSDQRWYYYYHACNWTDGNIYLL